MISDESAQKVQKKKKRERKKKKKKKQGKKKKEKKKSKEKTNKQTKPNDFYSEQDEAQILANISFSPGSQQTAAQKN